MNVVTVAARQWREQLQELISMALEQDTILVYARRDVPAFFVYPLPMTSIVEQHREWGRMCRIYAMATNQPAPSPIPLDQPAPWLASNALRRDLNETLIYLSQQNRPVLLRRYGDVIGMVVPITKGGGLGFLKTVCKWFAADQEREKGASDGVMPFAPQPAKGAPAGRPYGYPHEDDL